MNSQDFEFVSQLLRKRAGIVLTGELHGGDDDLAVLRVVL